MNNKYVSRVKNNRKVYNSVDSFNAQIANVSEVYYSSFNKGNSVDSFNAQENIANVSEIHSSRLKN